MVSLCFRAPNSLVSLRSSSSSSVVLPLRLASSSLATTGALAALGAFMLNFRLGAGFGFGSVGALKLLATGLVEKSSAYALIPFVSSPLALPSEESLASVSLSSLISLSSSSALKSSSSSAKKRIVVGVSRRSRAFPLPRRRRVRVSLHPRRRRARGSSRDPIAALAPASSARTSAPPTCRNSSKTPSFCAIFSEISPSPVARARLASRESVVFTAGDDRCEIGGERRDHAVEAIPEVWW